jgi:hypothetical protein
MDKKTASKLLGKRTT